MNQRINQLLIVVIISVFTSCSNESTNLASTEPDYIKIPDIQFETKLINLGIDSDGVINQKILKVDTETIESLDLSSESINDEIHDLAGIEEFLKLKKTVCHWT